MKTWGKPSTLRLLRSDVFDQKYDFGGRCLEVEPAGFGLDGASFRFWTYLVGSGWEIG